MKTQDELIELLENVSHLIRDMGNIRSSVGEEHVHFNIGSKNFVAYKNLIVREVFNGYSARSLTAFVVEKALEAWGKPRQEAAMKPIEEPTGYTKTFTYGEMETALKELPGSHEYCVFYVGVPYGQKWLIKRLGQDGKDLGYL